MVQQTALNAERVRDLKAQIGGLEKQFAQEIEFVEVAPHRRQILLYNMQTGEQVNIPQHMVMAVLEKRLEDGRYAFTADPEKAPRYRKGTIKCFLHPEAPERAIIEELGLSEKSCNAGSLRSRRSKRTHERNRHSDESAVYQEHVTSLAAQEESARQQQQLDATLALASKAIGAETGEKRSYRRKGGENQ